MKRAIITPTFRGHFSFITTYLSSFDRYVLDKNEIELYFIINRDELEDFNTIIDKHKSSCNIHVLIFDDILLKHGIYLSPQNLLVKYGRFSFQTLKKFYGIIEANSQYSLVLDSESSWVRETRMKELFDNYFNDPVCFCSNIDKDRFSPFCRDVQRNIQFISNSKNNLWFIEDFMWYYDKKILTEMFNEYGNPIEFVDRLLTRGKNEGCFEILLYRNYLYENADKYGYKFINVSDVCKNSLSRYIWENYYFELSHRLHGNFGVLEQVMMFLNDKNIDEFIKLFNHLGVNIMRCEIGKGNPAQMRFFNEVKPYIFASSQDHSFGVLKQALPATSFLNNIKNGYLKSKVKVLLKKLLWKCSPIYRFAIKNNELAIHNANLLEEIRDLLKKKDC